MAEAGSVRWAIGGWVDLVGCVSLGSRGSGGGERVFEVDRLQESDLRDIVDVEEDV